MSDEKELIIVCGSTSLPVVTMPELQDERMGG